MNLKELKQLKTIKAIRHDKNFVSNDDFIKRTIKEQKHD